MHTVRTHKHGSCWTWQVTGLLSMMCEAAAPCFEDFTSNELAEVCALTKIITIRKDEVVLEPGNIPSHLVFLIQGIVAVHTFGDKVPRQVNTVGAFVGGASWHDTQTSLSPCI